MKKSIVFIILTILVFIIWDGAQTPSDSRAATATQSQVPHPTNVLSFSPDAPQLAYLHISEAVAGQLPAVEPLQGRIAYNENLTSRITTPIAGRVTKIHVQLGDHVQAGQPLITLDSPEFAQASADMHRAESDMHLKQSAFERAKTLLDGGVLAHKDFEAADADLQQAIIERDRAQARLRNLGLSDSRSYILRTQVNGIVTESRVNPGSEVQPGDASNALFVVTNMNKLWVNVEIPEKDLGKIHVGQHLLVESDAYPDVSFHAVTVLVGNVVDAATRRVVVRAQLDNLDGRLKPEMYVRVTPLGSESQWPHVANEALVTDGLNSFLFVEKSPGVLERRRVTFAYRGHEQSYIDSGLTPGERVVVSGALLLNAELTGN